MSIVDSFYYFRARLLGILYNLLPNVSVGKRTLIEPGARLISQYGGTITVGQNFIICRGALLLTHSGDIKIGNTPLLFHILSFTGGVG